jgi:hypothetical protein
MFTGHDDGDAAQAVIVELKQWETSGPSEIEDCVGAFVSGRERDVLHPSRQVGNYKRYLQDVQTTFSEGSVGLAACSYLHNMRFDPSSFVFDTRFGTLLAEFPAYAGDQVDGLAGFLTDRLAGADGGPILDEVLKGRSPTSDSSTTRPGSSGASRRSSSWTSSRWRSTTSWAASGNASGAPSGPCSSSAAGRGQASR